MPGVDVVYPDDLGKPDLYPVDEKEHAELLAWCLDSFTAADAKRKDREDKWRRNHRMYRSYVEKKGAPGWRSAVYMPYVFSVIENIAPKMVSHLPDFVCRPIGPEDVIPAKGMEYMLKHASEMSDLHAELVLAIKSGLKFGTGILKNFYKQDIRKAYEKVPATQQVPQSQPQMNEDGSTAFDMDGNPITTTTMVEEPVLDDMGQPVMISRPYEYEVYSGPASKWVDVFDFWPAPEATDIQDARYVIQRSMRTVEEVEELIAQGVYRLPPGMTSVGDLWATEDENGTDIREQEVDLGNGNTDPNRHSCELLEFWTNDNRVITVANRAWVIRVQENPFWHGEKPYVRFVDYLQEGEFWGIGEVEAIEGLQDLANALINQRVDNVRLTTDAMFAVNTKAVEDERDLVIRPGGVIRISGDFMPSEAFQRIEMGDVTSQSFQEAQMIEQMIERVSGVTAYQLGMDSESNLNRTATGVSLITEAGNSKFALKVKLMELLALRPLARQWGSIIQQFTEDETYIRMLGANGMWTFATLSPDMLMGALDYTIDTMSTTQNETVQKEQAITLLQSVSGVLPMAAPQLAKDVLEAFGKKDFTPYFTGMGDLELMQQMMMAQQMGGAIIPFPQQQMGAPGQQGGPEQQEEAQQQ
jgi:hypothetical protein